VPSLHNRRIGDAWKDSVSQNGEVRRVVLLLSVAHIPADASGFVLDHWAFGDSRNDAYGFSVEGVSV